MYEAIAGAQSEVLVETFILREDKAGRGLHAALLKAARRGVQVGLTVDGFGSHALSPQFLGALVNAGVRVHMFAPVSRFLRRISYFRRLHRKLVVVDGRHAFVGGINFTDEHLVADGPGTKQDYAVETEGPVVAEIHRFMHEAIAAGNHAPYRLPCRCPQRALPRAGSGDALFVWRDNGEHRSDIERQYRLALRLARRRVVIANAYFFPGYSFLSDLRKAAWRGVEVSLILQGNPDMPIVQTAAAMLYEHLLHGGVRIFEYCERPLHSKVALVDDEWATVGSSNLDPLSLAFNLEANLMIRDRAFNAALDERLQLLMAHHCRMVKADNEARTWRKLRSFFLFHLLRRYPYWAGRLPVHAPRLALLQPAAPEAADGLDETACP